MSKYVALLRGIGPSNPNMHNENLRGVFEYLGFQNVRTVISSGNVLFETQSDNVEELEANIEKALPEKLGFNSTTIILRKDDLKLLVDKNIFGDIDDTPKSKLNVTFLKNKPEIKFEFPYQPKNKEFKILCIQDRIIYSIVDTTQTKTPELMSCMEKEFGKDITTRTWKTVNKILNKLNES